MSALRVYVAGGSAERASTVRPLLDALRSAGVIITHDWTVCEGYDRESTTGERREWARQDYEAVRSAGVVWVVMPEAKSEGAAVELGIAIALNKPIVISGPHARRTDRIFALLTRDIYDAHADALTSVLGRAKALAAIEGVP